MKEIENLGKKFTGYIDKRYGTEHHATFSIFECPKCLKHYELKRTIGLKRITCNSCKGTTLATHGQSNQLYYFVWQSMIQRCTNPNHVKYHIYGGKGITVQDSWLTFEGFWKDNEHLYQPGLTIDRKDSSKGYNVENVRWIPSKQNSSETTKRRPVEQYRVILLPVRSEELVQSWESAKQAADSLGLVAAHITATCSNKRKTHGGFMWKYKE